MDTVLFVENKEDVEKIEELKKNEEFLVIALDPEAAYALEKKRIAFNVQDDYFTIDEFLELGIENFNKVEQFCKYCDLFLKKNIDFLKINNLDLAFYHYFCFKILFDVVVSKIFVLKRIIEKEKAAQVYFFDNNIKESIDEKFYFKEKSPYNEVLKILCKYYNINYKIFNTRKNDCVANSPVNKNVSVIFSIYRIFKKIYDNLFNKYEQLPVIFMTAAGYDISYIAKLIKKKKNARILCFEPEINKTPYFIFPSWEKLKKISNDTNYLFHSNDFNGLWENLLKNKEFRDFFVFYDVDILPIIETRLKYFFTEFIEKLMNLYVKSLELFKEYKPKIFFTPHTHRGPMKVLVEAARKNAIPITVYQHGGVYGYTKYTVNGALDLQYADYLISFGEGIKQRHLNSRAKIIPVGSFILYDISKTNTAKNKIKIKKKLGINKDKKVIIFVMNPIFRNWKYIDYIYYTDHQCFNIQKKIIDVFAKYDKYQYIFKIFPCYNEKDPIVPYIEDKKKENFTVICDKFFKFIMPCADLIVMEAVSQPLLESLTTNQKIMIYDLYKGTFPDAVKVLKKRAYYSCDVDEYIKELDRVLNEGNFSIKNPDNEFSKLYGNFYNLEEMDRKLSDFLKEFICK